MSGDIRPDPFAGGHGRLVPHELPRQQRLARAYTPPKPPPAELGFDPEKWRMMTRAERRAVLRYAKGSKR